MGQHIKRKPRRLARKSCIYLQRHTMFDLNDLISPASGWTLYEANAINNSGQIVGDGINPLGQGHASSSTLFPSLPPWLAWESRSYRWVEWSALGNDEKLCFQFPPCSSCSLR